MAEIEAICGGNTRTHSFPILAVPELGTNDQMALEMALENQGCGYCDAREICRPKVVLIKVGESEGNVNVGATVTPGVRRLKEAGILSRCE